MSNVPEVERATCNDAFRECLHQFLTLDNPAIHPNQEAVVFATGCMVFGFLVVLVDSIFYYLRGRSLLNLAYTSIWQSLLVLLVWGIGSAIIGHVLGVAGVLQRSLVSCVVVGIAWPAHFAKLINDQQLDNDKKEDVEKVEEEEDEEEDEEEVTEGS